MNLEVLSRVFSVLNKQQLNDWIASEPSGQYARKAGFLYEWLTGDRLNAPNVSGNYQPFSRSGMSVSQEESPCLIWWREDVKHTTTTGWGDMPKLHPQSPPLSWF